MDLFDSSEAARGPDARISDIFKAAHDWMAASPDRWRQGGFFHAIDKSEDFLPNNVASACVWGACRFVNGDHLRKAREDQMLSYLDQAATMVSGRDIGAVVFNDGVAKSQEDILRVLDLARKLATEQGD